MERSDRAAAAAFGALLLVAATGAFRSLLLAAAVHDRVHRLQLVRVERTIGVLVPCLDLALAEAAGHRFLHRDLAVLVLVHLGDAALAFAALAFRRCREHVA